MRAHSLLKSYNHYWQNRDPNPLWWHQRPEELPRCFPICSPILPRLRRALTLPPSSCRPVSTQNCWSEACSVHWRVSLWSLCTATCGNYGFQARRVECVHARTNKAVPEHLCSWGPRPANWQRCNVTPCENSTFPPHGAFCQVPKGRACPLPPAPNPCPGHRIRFPKDGEQGPELGIFTGVPASRPRCVRGCVYTRPGHIRWLSVPQGTRQSQVLWARC